MFKKIAISCSLIACALTPLVAQAKISTDSGRSVEQVYKQCGLGGMLFGESSEILAIISNVTWDLGTTAALAEAFTPESCSGGSVRAAVLINEAFPSVEKDLAAGQGAHLTALTEVANCGSTVAMRSQYGTYAQSSAYQSATTQENVEMLYSIVNNTCSL